MKTSQRAKDLNNLFYPHIHNKFSPLQSDDDDDNNDTIDDEMTALVEEHQDDEVLGLGGVAQNKPVAMTVEAAIDSGAAHSVAPLEAAPGFPVMPSPGSRRGQHYVSAGGERIPNIGEQVIKFRTPEGRKSSIKWQNAPVTKPLLSVSHICDGGHEVTFKKDGGTVLNIKSGRVTEFRRKGNVYVLDMVIENNTAATTTSPAANTSQGFHRQGK